MPKNLAISMLAAFVLIVSAIVYSTNSSGTEKKTEVRSEPTTVETIESQVDKLGNEKQTTHPLDESQRNEWQGAISRRREEIADRREIALEERKVLRKEALLDRIDLRIDQLNKSLQTATNDDARAMIESDLDTLHKLRDRAEAAEPPQR